MPPPLVQITSVARQRLIQLLKSKGTPTALFAAEGGGCNGLRYRLEPVAPETPAGNLDEHLPLDDQHNLRVCGHSLMYLIGTEIQWEDSFMGQNFSFSNPNTAATCGCGATFTPKV